MTVLDSPIQRIKQRTQKAHEQVEALLSERFFSETMDRSRFNQLLETYYGIYAGLDPRLKHASSRDLNDYTYHERTPRLEKDLRILNDSDFDGDGLRTVPDSWVPELHSVEATLGSLYVVEGSENGNQVIWSTLDDQLSDEALCADHFFGHDSGQTKKQWQTFRAVFNDVIETASQLEDAKRAAQETFDLYRKGFS